jgi:hypothetical protein
MYTEDLTPFWVVFAIDFIAAMIIANWAEKKRSNLRFWPAFLISLFCSPIVGAICAALAPEREAEAEI